MKKILAFILGAILLLSLLTACNSGDSNGQEQNTGGSQGAVTESKHQHTFDDTWSWDSTSHWYQSNCGHDFKANLMDHVDDDKDGICDGCGWDYDHTHTYAEEWSHDETKHWKATTCGHVLKAQEGNHVDADNNGICDGCGWNYDHTHTFETEWSHDATHHWYAVSCGHDIAVRNKAAHEDTDNNGICDGCEWDYDHTHTFETEWSHDSENHWYDVSCGHDVPVKDKAPHTDLDNIGICDGCGWNYDHTHTYATGEDWTSDDDNHWHAATCGHDVAGVDVATHEDTDNDRICDVCGYDYDHTHTYDKETWSWNRQEHYHASTCGHAVRADVAPHEDKNNDGVCDGCSWNYDHEHTYDTENWSHDKTNHYHVPTCGHTISNIDVQAHEDKNNDGICDVCTWDYDHTHTFDTSKWVVGIDGHYHAPTCGHNPLYVRGDESEHIDQNRDDVCDVCNGEISMDVVIEKATNSTTASKVNGGTITEIRNINRMQYQAEITYEFGSKHLYMVNHHVYDYINEETGQPYHTDETFYYWYSKYANDKIFAIALDENSPVEGADDEGNGGRRVPYRNMGVEDLHLNGYSFSGEFISYAITAVGVEDLVYRLYYLVNDEEYGSNVKDLVTFYDNETGYYSFMFSYKGYNYGVYFKVNDEFVMETVYITGGTGFADMTAEGKEYVISIKQTVGERTAVNNEYAPEKLLINSFVLKGPDGQVLNDGDMIEILAGSKNLVNLSITDVLPTTANASFDKIVAISNDTELISFNNNGTVIVNGQSEGVWNLTLSSDHVSITIKVKVTYPAPTEIGPAIYYPDGRTSTASEVEMFLGDILYFNAAVNEHADSRYKVSVLRANASTYELVEATTVEISGRELKVSSFVPKIVGKYIVQISSIAAPQLYCTFTITVSEKPTVEELLSGNWQMNYSGSILYEVSFAPESEGATKGTVTIVDSSRASGMSGSKLTTVYTYEYFEDGIQLVYASGDENVINLKVTENMELKIQGNGGTFLLLTRKA